MSIFKCKMCGGTLEIQEGLTVAECEYCGSKQTLPKLSDEKRSNLYDRANHFRRSNEFDKASAIYEKILVEDGSDSEAYWSLVLCRYGIEYVEDPRTHKRVPTVHRAQFTSIFDDDNYKSALKHADMYQRAIYEEEAKAINEIQKGILAISQKEDPFDVFICYKETDDSGRRTHDSVIAQELYYELKEEGFKTFFARITLEDKLGTAYEPYIFAALNSAKVMVVIGTTPEHFNAVWVKNEWSRFLSLIKKGERKMLIPAYKDMDPYDLPKEFSHLQAQDMSKLGFMQDLLRAIKKIVNYEKRAEAPKVERIVVQGDGYVQDTAPLLRRAYIFLEDGEFDSADEYAEKVLDINPEHAEAYFVKLLVEMELRNTSELERCREPISHSSNYQKAVRFATPEYKAKLEEYNEKVIKSIEISLKEDVYSRGLELMDAQQYEEAVQWFQRIEDYKDSQEKIEECATLKETARKDALYSRAIYLFNGKRFDESAVLFELLEDYRDAKEKIEACKECKELARKDHVYSQAIKRVSAYNVTDEDYKRSMAELQTISGHKDADEMVERLKARLAKWYEDKKAADEAERISKRKAIMRCTIFAIVAVIILALIITCSILTAPYEIGYDFDGGEATDYVTNYTMVSGDIALPNPVQEGYTFVGWTGEGFENPTVDAVIPGFSSGDRYYTAHWKANTYTITFDTAGGDPMASQSVTYNSDFYLSTPTRTGYTFEGWYLDGKSFYGGTWYDTSDITLTAMWKAKSYGVKFGDVSAEAKYTVENSSESPWEISNGILCSTNTADDSTSEYKIIAGGPLEVSFKYKTSSESSGDYLYIKKNGYKEKSASGNYYSSYNSFSISLVEGDILSFIYSKDSYGQAGDDCAYISDLLIVVPSDDTESIGNLSLKYDSGNFYPLQTVTFGNQYTLPVVTREGYAFLGWYYGETKVESGNWSIASEDIIVLLPKWEAGGNTVTLNAAGGTVSQNSLAVKYDQQFTLPTPEKTGYTFDGWYSGDVEYVSGLWKGLADVTLTAKWTANEYTLTFADTKLTKSHAEIILDHNYTGSTNTVVTVAPGQIFNYPAPPTREGYAFVGWYADSDCTTPYNFSGTIAHGATLYAKWVAMSSPYNTRTYVDVAQYNKSDSMKTISTTSSSSSKKDLYYFTCYKTGTYTFYGKPTAGDFYITVMNDTSGSSIVSNTNLYGSSSITTKNFTATAGDVICISLYNYGGATSTSSCNFYVTGAEYPTSTAVVTGGSVVTGASYAASETDTDLVSYGTVYTLPSPVRTGYFFRGWYNGNTKIESGTWNYTSNLTLTPKWEAVVYYDVTLADSTRVSTDVKVTHNYNYSGAPSPSTVTLTNGQTLTVPSTPTRSGYVFTGWYTNASCTTRYNFSGTITQDMTLYAGWAEMTMSYVYSETQIDPTEYTSETSCYSVSTSSTSSSSKKNIYLVAEEAGTHYIYYKNSYYSSSYGYYLQIYNLTTGTTIKSSSNCYSTNYASYSFSCSKGDIIVITLYKYSSNSSYYSDASFYFAGFGSPAASTAQASCSTQYAAYSEGDSLAIRLGYGESYTLPTLTRTGYTFDGWYNGDTKIANSGTWSIASTVELKPKWI